MDVLHWGSQSLWASFLISKVRKIMLPDRDVVRDEWGNKVKGFTYLTVDMRWLHIKLWAAKGRWFNSIIPVSLLNGKTPFQLWPKLAQSDRDSKSTEQNILFCTDIQGWPKEVRKTTMPEGRGHSGGNSLENQGNRQMSNSALKPRPHQFLSFSSSPLTFQNALFHLCR